jgi:mevalonate kinase
VKADTPYYIRKVAEAFKNKKEELTQMFEEVRTYVSQAKEGLVQGDFISVGQAMTKNHQVLQRLGVSIPKLDAMVEETIKAGAYGAKLSGAGGGDCMIALVDPLRKSAVEQAIEHVGGEVIHVELQANGVE